MLRKALCVIGLSVAVCSHVSAQAPSTPHYDVVSIKPNKADNQSTYWRWMPDGFSMSNVTVVMLITSAYNTREDLVSGMPDWTQKAHFDVGAKASDADPETLKKLTGDQRNAMMAEILVDRFHLRIHPETKQLPVYELVLAKEGSRLTPNAAVPEKDPSAKPKQGMGPGMVMMNYGEFTAIAVPLSTFIRTLEGELNRNVIDRTGLTANYDIHLKWTPDRSAPAGPDSGQTDAAPPLFTALQEQLGLKLVPAKGPVQTWVVDHVEQPTEN